MEARVPPFSEEAEASTLGSVLLDPKLIRKCIKKNLTPEHFYIPANRTIFEAMLDLLSIGQPSDITIVMSKLKEQRKLTKSGGQSYLTKLCDNVATVTHVEHYIDIVIDKHKRRQVISVSREAESAAYESEESANKLLSNIKCNFNKLAFSTDARNTIPNSVAKLATIYQKARKTGVSIGIQSRWFDVRQKISGYAPKKTYVVAGRPGQGKTVLSHNEVLFDALNGIPCLVATIEMTQEETVERMIGDLMGLNIHKFRQGRSTPEEIELFRKGGAIISKLPIYIIDGSMTIEQYDTAVREHHAEHGIKLAVLDYIQIVSPTLGAKHANRNLEITHMSQTIQRLGTDTGVSQVIISQLSRSFSHGKNQHEEPELHHLRDSGAIEQDAYAVMFVYQDPSTGDDYWEDNAPTIFKVAKNRGGPCGKVSMIFQKTRQRFVGVDDKILGDDLLEAWIEDNEDEDEAPF